MIYSYRAVDQQGNSHDGEREAGSDRELADALRSEGLILLDAKNSGEKRSRWKLMDFVPRFFRHIPLFERMVFARNLAVMVGAGLPLTRALEALAAQTTNTRFREVLVSLRDGIVSGMSLADSLRSFESLFGVLFINMVEAGELSGNLERTLLLLSQQMKRDHDLRAKVRGAMVYPAIVLGALIGIGALMMIYVVPTLTQTFSELEINLPLSTRIVLGTSNFLISYTIWVIVGCILLVAGCVQILHTRSGKQVFDTVILRVPVLGPLVMKLNSARFARTLSSLIASGIPIVRSLEVTAAVLGNTCFRIAITEAAGAIQQGKQLSLMLNGYPNLFPPLVTQMIQVGEETGTISRMLLRLALFYEEEVTMTTKNLSSIVEPALMIVIGGIVGFFAISMIQPIYSGLGNL